jgi:hypothetical protein
VYVGDGRVEYDALFELLEYELPSHIVDLAASSFSHGDHLAARES